LALVLRQAQHEEAQKNLMLSLSKDERAAQPVPVESTFECTRLEEFQDLTASTYGESETV